VAQVAKDQDSVNRCLCQREKNAHQASIFKLSGDTTPLWLVLTPILVLMVASIFKPNAEPGMPRCQTETLEDHLPFVRLSGCEVKDFLKAGSKGAEKLRELMMTHGLLVFADQHLTPGEEVAVNKLFGYHTDVEVESGTGWAKNSPKSGLALLPSQPEVLCQGTAALQDHFGLTMQLKQVLTYENEGFHSDGVHNLHMNLPVLTSMYTWKAPERGGHTFFSCGRLAFRNASPELQTKARRLRVHYIYDESLGLPIMSNGIMRAGREDPKKSTWVAEALHTVHPLIRTHPETGDESVYLSCGNVDYMEADPTATEPAIYLDTNASYELVETLVGGVTAEPLVYAHKWKENDFAIWDNRLTLHAPGKMDVVGSRLHHRVRLPGSATANHDLKITSH